MSDNKELAKAAIAQGRTMGQFLRDLPGSKQMTRDELQEYAKVYVEVRSGQ